MLIIELMKRIEREKPLIITMCKMKSKHSKEHEIQGYAIPDYTMDPVKQRTGNSQIYSNLHRQIYDPNSTRTRLEEACLLQTSKVDWKIRIVWCQG